MISEDGKKNAGSVPSKAKEQKRAWQQQRRKCQVREGHKKGKRKDQPTDLHLPPEGRAKAFKDAGLPSKTLWSLSYRNKARRISQLEAEPDKSKLIMFDLHKGLIWEVLWWTLHGKLSAPFDTWKSLVSPMVVVEGPCSVGSR